MSNFFPPDFALRQSPLPATQNQQPDAKIYKDTTTEEFTLADHKHEKHEETFRVIDRRPFTAEGELRKEVVEEQEREARREATVHPLAPAAEAATKTPPPPSADAPARSPAFENLVRMLGSNAAMVLGAYADPQTGQPVIDPEAARELIDMLDALQCSGRGPSRASFRAVIPTEEGRLFLALSSYER